MIAMTHHIPPAWDSSMTVPRREDCLRWQGQTLESNACSGEISRGRNLEAKIALGCGL
jgi:hypothetical protein